MDRTKQKRNTWCKFFFFTITHPTLPSPVVDPLFVSYANVNVQNPERPILQRFTYIVVPLVVARDVFIIVDIVMIYVSYASWSTASQQALAFLLIVFGQYANLGILAMVVWGAWSMGKQAGRKGSVDKISA